MATSTGVFAPFIRQRTVLLTSYRRNGTPVGTPVHVAVDGDRAFARTWDATWKVKRIRNNPLVEIAPSTFRGRPTGPAIQACARLLDGDQARYAARALARKYRILHGFLIPMVHRLRGYSTVHIELTPVDLNAVPTVREAAAPAGIGPAEPQLNAERLPYSDSRRSSAL
jgi:uncharacterized protein